MIPRISTKNIGLSILVLFIISYIMGDIILPKITINHQLGIELYFIFCLLTSILYILWFFGKIGKDN